MSQPNHPSSLFRLQSLALVLPLLALHAACSNDAPSAQPPGPPDPGSGEFESANPSGAGSSSRDGGGVPNGAGGSTATGSGTGGSGGPVATPDAGGEDDGGAGRAIEEADIVNVTDGRLYALSRYGGLSVIDVSAQDELTLLGRHKIVATPFEMYVRDGIVLALYNGYSEYSYSAEDELWTYYQTSFVVALDARDPSSISELSRFVIPGDISDSRIIGDALYVAAHENGYCWGCSDAPRTNLLSLDVANPADVRLVDELSFEEREGSYSWKRSLSATDRRLYIAGPRWGDSEPVGSTIQVVDVSDPGGDMELGASVEVKGQINSRWQMDEFEGVLRVVSQPFAWRLDTPPSVQTFRVESSASLVPLASLDLVLPRPEQLMSARFDGNRGYAITAERTDPLFTIDLSDPAAPRQTGELEMPGWVYHMEPRGDRVLGLGYDQGNEAGALTVSLFDVSDLTAPSMLSRVNFGGDWATLGEDQDRIHKAFKLLDEHGLILVPFSGYSYREADGAGLCGYGEYLSGVQLVDWQNDSLDLRGVAPSIGEARRGFIHDDRLLTMSDERVESFDIGDRDEPRKTAELAVAQVVNQTAPAGNGLVRIGHNWWTQRTELDFVTLAGAESPLAAGRLELPELDEQGSCYSSGWLDGVYSHDTNVYLTYTSYEYDPMRNTDQYARRVLTVDVSNPTAPAVVGTAELGVQTGYYNYYGSFGIVSSGAGTVQVGTTLVMSRRNLEYAGDRYRPVESALEIVDLSEPTSPAIQRVELPPSIGFSGLVQSGSIVATSHHEDSAEGRVRFYLDRVDVSDPRQPIVLPPLNVPGSLLAYDAASEHAVTVDYWEEPLSDVTYRECYERYGYGSFQPALPGIPVGETTRGTCTVLRHTLHLVKAGNERAAVVDSYDLPAGERVATTALGDDRLFVTTSAGYGYYYGGLADVAYGYYSSFASRPVPLIVLSGIRSGSFAAARLELDAGDSWGYVPLVASGKKAVLSTGFRGELSVVDARDARAPFVAQQVELRGYVNDLDVVGTTAVAALGYDGVQTVSLAP